MNIRLKRYQKDFEHSYSFGVYATLELLEHHLEHAVSVLVSSRGERSSGVGKLQNVCASRGIPVELNDSAIERLSPKESHMAVGVFRKYVTQLDAARDHVVLAQPSDMGNLGTIMRTMTAFGLSDLALIRPAVDVFDPRAVRASMGALFQLSFEYFDNFDAYRARFEHWLYPLMTDGGEPLGEVDFISPHALVFGSESSGLGAEFHDLGTSVRIPHSGSVDSLNLSVAAGITIYAAAQKRLEAI